MLPLSNWLVVSKALYKSVSILFWVISTFVVGCLSCQANGSGELADDLMIKELMARYMFAMDWRNAEDFAATFIEDGILEYSQGEHHGHDALKGIITNASRNDQQQNENVGTHKPVQRTSIHNIVTEVDGDYAKAWSYWSAIDNRTKERKPRLVSFGHYEDELVKIDGRWYFSKRVIYSENSNTKHSSSTSPLRHEAE